MNTVNAPLEPFDYRAHQAAIAWLLERQLFFIGGVEKSGTSWLQLLLDTHPQVSCGGESHFVGSLYRRLKSALEEHHKFLHQKNINPARYELRGKQDNFFEEVDLNYLMASALLTSVVKQTRRKSALAFGERTPDNVLFFDGLSKLIPDSKCIHIVRDPRDVAVSHWHNVRRSVPEQMRSQMVTMTAMVRQHVEWWVGVIEGALNFAARNPDRYCEVRYEDLVSQPVPTLARLCRFLGVDDRPEVLQPCLDETSFRNLSGGRSPGQEDKESFFRKGIIGDWKNYLDPETNEYVIGKAGAFMGRYGYI